MLLALFNIIIVLLFPNLLGFRMNQYVLKIHKRVSMQVDQLETEKCTSMETFDHFVHEKLPWIPAGYRTWKWKDHNINYVDVGGETENSKPPLLLIHGFGASVYHWRYNIPILARNYHVFAIDLLGFGLSDKPIVEYSADVWRDQVLDFIKEKILPVTNKPCVVAGNSLGGFTALYAAASNRATTENLINGCILLNAAGRFKSETAVEEKKENPQWLQAVQTLFQKVIIRLSFIYTKQPSRITQILRQVYPVKSLQVDNELVDSIYVPALNPNAPEVFYRVISRNGNGPPILVDDLLSILKLPLLLLWGVKDPWIRTNAADRIQALYPSAFRADVDAGHCPHDEAPNEVNKEISTFMNYVFNIK